MPRKKETRAVTLAAGKKYLDQEGLAHLVKKNDARYVRQEEGKGLSKNDFTDEYKKIVDDLNYKKIVINSMTATNSSNEIGATVAATDVAWILSKEPKTQKIKFGSENEETLGNSLRKKNYTGKAIKTNTNIVLTVTDERDAIVTRTVGITFQPKVYWGKSNKEQLENADILAAGRIRACIGKSKELYGKCWGREKIV